MILAPSGRARAFPAAERSTGELGVGDPHMRFARSSDRFAERGGGLQTTAPGLPQCRPFI
jgi:hypothetical protein